MLNNESTIGAIAIKKNFPNLVSLRDENKSKHAPTFSPIHSFDTFVFLRFYILFCIKGFDQKRRYNHDDTSNENDVHRYERHHDFWECKEVRNSVSREQRHQHHVFC